jgi:hypothetical protein
MYTEFADIFAAHPCGLDIHCKIVFEEKDAGREAELLTKEVQKYATLGYKMRMPVRGFGSGGSTERKNAAGLKEVPNKLCPVCKGPLVQKTGDTKATGKRWVRWDCKEQPEAHADNKWNWRKAEEEVK